MAALAVSQPIKSKAKDKAVMPPNNIDAEVGVLGSILIDPDAMIDTSFLAASDFYLTKHGWIYDVLKSLFEARKPIDLLMVNDELDRRGQLDNIGGPGYITDLMNETPTAMHAAYYARLVYRDAVRRRIAQAATEISQLAYATEDNDPEEILGQAQSVLLDVEANRAVEKGPQSTKAAVERLFDRVEALHNQTSDLIGLPTGLKDLDRLLSGFGPGKLYVLAGRPGMGKSGLALTLARNLAKIGKRVLIFSLEMPESEVINRLVAAESGLDSKRLEQGKLSDPEWADLLRYTGIIGNYPIHIDDSPNLKAGVIRSRALRHAAKHGVDMVIIDHMGKVRPDNDRIKDEYQSASYVSNAMLTMAKELRVPVLALSQLNRNVESTHDKIPRLWHLRDSGRIEEDAHAVMFLYRDEYYHPEETKLPNIADIIIAKNRSGETGSVQAFYQKKSTAFFDPEIRREPLSYGNS